MAIYSSPPLATSFSEAKPTLIVAWWITAFCTCLILLRLAGRYIRVERLFLEDKISALALIPLYIRMALVHVVLLYGTNNVQLDSFDASSSKEVYHRTIGSRLVLAARIFNAATLWTLKFTTLEFLNRLAGASMKRLYVRQIEFLRYALLASFIAVIVSDLAECQPITHYWQVSPDPGPQCRQGFAQLLTTGISSAIIDIILIVFPIPIVLSTRIATKRKVLLVLLFFFGFVTVGITIYRLPNIIQQRGDQVYRSMWASIELFAATVVANLVALGSFLRDSGAKKTKFRRSGYGSSGNTSSQRPGGVQLTGDWDESSKTHNNTNKQTHYNDDWTSDEVAPDANMAKDVEGNAQSESKRGHSPTESQHSLLRYYNRPPSTNRNASLSLVPGVVDPAHQQLEAPRAVMVAGRSGRHRR